MSETCATCRFFAVADSGIHAECRKAPPTVYGDGHFSGARFPPTKPAHWCGEHRPAEQPERDAYTLAAVRYAEAVAQTVVLGVAVGGNWKALSAELDAFLRLYREKRGG